jgi:hypothetical protein
LVGWLGELFAAAMFRRRAKKNVYFNEKYVVFGAPLGPHNNKIWESVHTKYPIVQRQLQSRAARADTHRNAKYSPVNTPRRRTSIPPLFFTPSEVRTKNADRFAHRRTKSCVSRDTSRKPTHQKPTSARKPVGSHNSTHRAQPAVLTSACKDRLFRYNGVLSPTHHHTAVRVRDPRAPGPRLRNESHAHELHTPKRPSEPYTVCV